MFKKINSTALIIILLLLAGLVAFNKFYLSKKTESTFNEEFVKIDSAKVTQILFRPKPENGKAIKLTKQGKVWEVEEENRKGEADSFAVAFLIHNFDNLKSNALVGSDRSGWNEFQISDSSGIPVQFKTSDNKSYDFVIGKFGYNQAMRTGISYIRRKNEDAVYAVDGFLSFTLNQPLYMWRNRKFIRGTKAKWKSFTFSYAGEKSFVLDRQDDTWSLDGKPADSVKVAQYLAGLSAVQVKDFADQYTPSSAPVYNLEIQENNQSAPYTLVAYQTADSVQKFILHSSLNKDAYFISGNSRVAEEIFKDRDYFLP